MYLLPLAFRSAYNIMALAHSKRVAFQGKCATSRPSATPRISIARACPQRRDQNTVNTAATSPLQQFSQFSAACIAALILSAGGADARPEGVNRPDLLPKEQTTVIDVAGFLTPSEEQRVAREIENLERDTGIKLRLLAQNYPETPGLAIRDYWGVDENTIVFVADPTFGDILNFNVGAGVDLEVPRSFWGRLAGQYGNKFYWQEKGEAESILNAVSAIDTCLREPPGRFKCAKVQGEFGEKSSSGKFGGFFGQ